MTVIAAISDGKHVWMGSDTCVTDSGTDTLADPKVVITGGWIMGVAGEVWALTALRHRLKLKPGKIRDIQRYASTTLVDAIRKAFHRHAGATPDADLLIARDGQIFICDPALCMTRSARGYNAIGSGAGAARASLHTTAALIEAGVKIKPETRIELALQAAADTAKGVSGPFHVHKY